MKTNSFAFVFASFLGLSYGRINNPDFIGSEQEDVIDNGEYGLGSKKSAEIEELLRGLAISNCGGGNRGNGVCANPSHCCSVHGWCGTSLAHCKNSVTSTTKKTKKVKKTKKAKKAKKTKKPKKTKKAKKTTTTTTQRKCGGGNRGNGVCADPSDCCSIHGWCGKGPDHCKNSPEQTTPTKPIAPTPNPPSLPQTGEPAFLTYHMYFEKQPLTQVSCSDGVNGLMTKWNYNTIESMWPYVAATSNLSWNSPVCGTCYAVSSEATGKTIYITTIDKVAHPGPNNELHFDLSFPAFYELLGDAGYNAGSAFAKFKVVDASYCRGNKGN